MTLADKNKQDLAVWFEERGIEAVECVVADIAGVARGKILPVAKFLSDAPIKLAESVYAEDVKGEVIFSDVISPLEPDVVLVPDLDTLNVLPWKQKKTASVICDSCYDNGDQVPLASRQVLKKVIAQYAEQGLTSLVAPEFEFYLIEPVQNFAHPLQPPRTRSGGIEQGCQTYGLDLLQEFEAIIETLYDYCHQLGIDIDVLTHEAGPGQYEVNIQHGDPLMLADHVFLFKRAAREAALQHGKQITFMAKPHAGQPGNAMHIHQSVMDQTGKNIFSKPDGSDAEQLLNFIAGVQAYSSSCLAFYAPFVNSYRRFVRNQFAPVNTHWSHENRTVGLRIPDSGVQDRRLENRLIGADANPYLAFSASMMSGLLGLREQLFPSEEMLGDAYKSDTRLLAMHLVTALDDLRDCDVAKKVFGEAFIRLFCDVKDAELRENMNIVSTWDRKQLLNI